MARYRTQLPQLDRGIYLTDSGLETTLVLTDGIELKEFAAFELLKDAEGCDRIYTYFARRAAIAAQNRFHIGQRNMESQFDLGGKAGIFRRRSRKY